MPILTSSLTLRQRTYLSSPILQYLFLGERLVRVVLEEGGSGMFEKEGRKD
jgi:hypothetical protein